MHKLAIDFTVLREQFAALSEDSACVAKFIDFIYHFLYIGFDTIGEAFFRNMFIFVYLSRTYSVGYNLNNGCN